MQVKSFITLMLATLWLGPVTAEESAYSGLESRDIKALSEQQVDGYLGGMGMSLALAGELNGYPGPKHVIELAEPLDLSEMQRKQMDGIFEAMQSQAMSVGKRIVEAEASLDELFVSGQVDSESLNAATAEIGRLTGQLRAIHLQAHLDTKGLLSTHQVHRYLQLRGYAGDGHNSMEHHQ